MFDVLIPRDPASHEARVRRLKEQGHLLPASATKIPRSTGNPPTLAERLALAIRAHAKFTGSASVPDLERMPLKKLYALWIQMGNQAMRRSRDRKVADIRHLPEVFRFDSLREIEES